MGSVLQGAVSGLLYAEITGRIPLVYWHPYCKYLKNDPDVFQNAFLDFYQQLPSLNVETLFASAPTTFPADVELDTLHDVLSEFHRRLGEQDSHLEQMQSQEAQESNLLIFPSYISMGKVMNLLADNHQLKCESREEVAAYIAKKYFRLKAALLRKVDKFWTEHFNHKKHVVTVHIRGGDKYQESIMPRFSRYKDEVDRYIRQYPEAGIFLATDSTSGVTYFKKHFGDKVVTAPAFRSSGRQGVHKSGEDGQRIGNEILFDVECLSRGNHFIGFDESNVYFWVCQMTENGWDNQFSHLSVRSGLKEIFTSRQSLKSAVKDYWKKVSCS